MKSFDFHIGILAIIISVVSLGCGAVIIVRTLPAAYQEKYYPIANDEYEYVLNARAGYFHHTLQSSHLTYQATAPLLRAGIHGPAYTVLDALTITVTKARIHGFITRNLLFLLVAFCLPSIFFKDKKSALLAAGVLGTFFIPILYISVFMQELTYILLSVILALLVIRFTTANRVRWRGVLIFTLSVVLVSLFRPVFLIWMLGLFFFKTTLNRWYRFLICLASFILIASYTYYFTGLFQFQGQHSTHLLTKGSLLFTEIWTNSIAFFTIHSPSAFTPGAITNYLVLLLTLMTARFWEREKNPIWGAVCIISGCVLLLLLSGVYSTTTWTTYRMLAAVYILITFALAAERKYLIVAGVIVVQLFFLTQTLALDNTWRSYRTRVLTIESQKLNRAITTIESDMDQKSRKKTRTFHDLIWPPPENRIVLHTSIPLYVDFASPLLASTLTSPRGRQIVLSTYTKNLREGSIPKVTNPEEYPYIVWDKRVPKLDQHLLYVNPAKDMYIYRTTSN